MLLARRSAVSEQKKNGTGESSCRVIECICRAAGKSGFVEHGGSRSRALAGQPAFVMEVPGHVYHPGFARLWQKHFLVKEL